MTGRYIYPRIEDGLASRLIDMIRTAYQDGGLDAVTALASLGHADAVPTQTGGIVADEARVRKIREATVGAISQWTLNGRVPDGEKGTFDLTLGEVLHAELEIVPGDAAHDETWNFLGLVVLPDVMVLRFPNMHQERMFGGTRNPLRGSWIRWDLFGDFINDYPQPLGVDEMVQLVERSELARNRPLIRAVAKCAMQYDGSKNRPDFVRELMKRVLYATGPRLLDGVDEDELLMLMETERWTEF